MGGSAFKHLFTPRMLPGIYQQVLVTYHDLLQPHFEVVRSALEAPEKETYGDIDILVSGPKSSSPLHDVTARDQQAVLLAKILGAEDHIFEQGNHTINFAIPWPNEVEVDGIKSEVRHVQIDLGICSTLKALQWELFHSAHGDLWNILGSTIRKYGLTVNNLGLYLRITEIEAKDRKRGMVFLTDDPKKILEFIGLEEEKWWKQFASKKAMFEYAAGCRLFWVRDEEEKVDESLVGEEGKGEKEALKHTDKQKVAKRPIFKEWIEEFVPQCRSQPLYRDRIPITREQVRDEAFKAFGPEVKATYETRLHDFNMETHADHIWRFVVKANVPEDMDPQRRACCVRVLKGVIMEGDSFEGKDVPEVAKNEEGLWDEEKVKAWIEQNWRLATSIGWFRQQRRAMEKMKAQDEKKRLLEETEDNDARKRLEIDSSEQK